MGEICRHLSWDTEFFGLRVARVVVPSIGEAEVGRIDEWCASEQVSCLYLMVGADDRPSIRAAEKGGFRLVDVRVELNGPATRLPKRRESTAPGIVCRDGKPSDSEVLERIAGSSFNASRYYFDEGFRPEQCQALYETWVRRSLEGYAQHVIVGALEGRPAGFISCHLEGTARKQGRIGLLGVGAEARGLGLGKALVRCSLAWFADQGCDKVRVVTQGRNVPAQRLYQGCGFRTEGVWMYYHKWYGGHDGR